ncbi:MAG: hypothetical protein AAYR31_00435 [Candidatus Vidania fulgoroideorum]
MIKPINKYIFLKKIKLKNKNTKIIEYKKYEKNTGKVIYIPENKKIKKIINKGDIVFYIKYHSNKLNILSKKYIVIKLKNIIGILKKNVI